MEQRRLDETYQGRELSIMAFEVRRGWWSWSYLIDGKNQGSSTAKSVLSSADAALARGLAAAKARVGELG
jgi:hypothetical protein